MGWILLIFIGAVAYGVLTIDKSTSLKSRIRTADGKPKIDAIVFQCDNLPQGIKSTIICTQHELIITSNGYEKVILHEDIIDISIEPANQVINNPKFSFGKAVVGTALFGSVGAIAGLSRKTELKMMIISYIKEDEITYMVFLQQSNKERSMKAESYLLEKICKDMRDIIKR